jgi:hypothetical protein
MTKYTVDYFIKKFSAIPKKNWTTGKLQDPMNPDVRCAIGHCGMPSNAGRTEEAKALYRLIDPTSSTARINDGRDSAYPQKHPRSRVLAALRDIKKRGAK